MPGLFSRRHVIGAAGAVTLAPLVLAESAKAAVPLPVVVPLLTPLRVFDSRTDTTLLGGQKLATGGDVIVTVPPFENQVDTPSGVFANITVTATEGAGYLVAYPNDSSGERPFPETSNVNWFATGQTLANAVYVALGNEAGISISARGAGKVHFIVDVTGYTSGLIV